MMGIYASSYFLMKKLAIILISLLPYLFLKKAKKYKALPLDDRTIQRFDVQNRSSVTTGRNSFSYFTSVDVGQDRGSAVVDSYQIPFKFTGNLEQVKLDLL